MELSNVEQYAMWHGAAGAHRLRHPERFEEEDALRPLLGGRCGRAAASSSWNPTTSGRTRRPRTSPRAGCGPPVPSWNG